MSQAGTLTTGGSTPGDVATSYVTDSGTAVPSGNVLNVNGSNGLTTSGSGNTIIIHPDVAPSKAISDFDDFLATNNANGSKFVWDQGPYQPINGTATNPGLWSVNAAAGSAVAFYFGLGQATNFPFILGGGTLSINFVHSLVALSDNTNNYTFYIGLTDNNSGAKVTPVNGCYFSYNHAVNGGKFQINTAKAGVRTTLDSGVLATTGFINFGITVNAAGTSVAFFINGTQVTNSPIATNIPTVAIAPSITTTVAAGTTPGFILDLFYYSQTLTVSR